LIVGVAWGLLGATAEAADVGTIKGRIALTGKPPGNVVIRMGLDPMCAAMNRGKQVLQEAVVTGANGGLANVFVRLQGSFPQTPVPAAPVTIDQRGCIYMPRVVGARVGQTLQIRNSDPVLHNVHSLSNTHNTFNVGQPQAGVAYQFKLKDEEVMMRIACDVHRWMTTFVGVVSHPYFAVSGNDGTFEIANVPVGTYTIQTWHERFGNQMQPVRVRAGATTTVNFAYTGAESTPRTQGTPR
jgi:plastocyanin